VPPTARQLTLDRFHAAVARVDALIERDNTPHGKSQIEIRARAEMRLERMRRFLAFLDNPQRRFPVIHVTGTSGKGSTSTAIARILEASGLRVGLHTSPYLQTPTEKLQLDGRLIAPDRFVDQVDRTLSSHDRWVVDGNDPLTYGEIWVALVCLAFAEAQVDVGVIEVGAGGRFDLTNVVEPAVSVITSVGIDHVVTLGNTIAEIAWHKAGIVKPDAPVVTAVTDPVALAAIETEAERAGVPVIRVLEGETWKRVGGDEGGTTRWRDLTAGGIDEVLPAPPGAYQAGNTAVALAAVRAFAAANGSTIGSDAIVAGLAATRIPGRYEIVQRAGAPTIILDGAHNPQKMAALMADIGPRSAGRGQRLVIVLGALEAKQIDEMASLVSPWATAIVATSPKVLAKAGAETVDLANAIKATGFGGDVHAIAAPLDAIDRALAIASELPDAVVLVTGSLYLIGNVRGRWFPDDSITMAQTPWPGTAL
jgi:dihydrofolate synthase/folylpolyglutamate synthase